MNLNQRIISSRVGSSYLEFHYLGVERFHCLFVGLLLWFVEIGEWLLSAYIKVATVEFLFICVAGFITVFNNDGFLFLEINGRSLFLHQGKTFKVLHHSLLAKLGELNILFSSVHLYGWGIGALFLFIFLFLLFLSHPLNLLLFLLQPQLIASGNVICTVRHVL